MTTRERVLAAALASFGGRGYEATSLDQLAVELGIRKQTILYYYPSKAELLDAVIGSGSRRSSARSSGWPCAGPSCSACCVRSAGSGPPPPPG
jgi:hypothetical protein